MRSVLAVLVPTEAGRCAHVRREPDLVLDEQRGDGKHVVEVGEGLRPVGVALDCTPHDPGVASGGPGESDLTECGSVSVPLPGRPEPVVVVLRHPRGSKLEKPDVPHGPPCREAGIHPVRVQGLPELSALGQGPLRERASLPVLRHPSDRDEDASPVFPVPEEAGAHAPPPVRPSRCRPGPVGSGGASRPGPSSPSRPRGGRIGTRSRPGRHGSSRSRGARSTSTAAVCAATIPCPAGPLSTAPRYSRRALQGRATVCDPCVTFSACDGRTRENGQRSEVFRLTPPLLVGFDSSGSWRRREWSAVGLRPILDRLAERRGHSSTRSQPARLEPYGFTHRLSPMPRSGRSAPVPRLPPSADIEGPKKKPGPVT